MKRPSLGMVPLFMAGDKEFFFHANRLQKELDLKLTVFCENRTFESTKFKSGFAGVREGSNRLYSLNILNKVKLLSYYASQYFLNPGYFNLSIIDSIKSFWFSYFIDHDFFFLFDYFDWEEKKVQNTIENEFDWEVGLENVTSWRNGDGTAPFYNYIYHTFAGFTENDTFRSNQIRSGRIGRDDALNKVQIENQPRWTSLKEYFSILNLDPDIYINRINEAAIEWQDRYQKTRELKSNPANNKLLTNEALQS